MANSFSFGGSLALSAFYLVVLALVAICLGSALALLLFIPRLRSPRLKPGKTMGFLTLLHSSASFFPFSFLFFITLFLMGLPSATTISPFVPLIPLSIYGSIHFSLQAYQYFNQSFTQGLQMTTAIGLSPKSTIGHLLLPALKHQIPVFTINTLLSSFSPLVICGMVSGHGIGGHFLYCFNLKGPATYLWMADGAIVFITIVLLLILRKALTNKNPRA